jgi:Ca2+-transporting ATPase
MDAGRKRVHHDRNDALAEEGLRVLAVAWRTVEDDEDLKGGYTFLGFLGLRDPLREGAAETVRGASRSGIRTVILTGDQLPTARAVARAVGLEGELLRGDELEELLASDGEEARRRVAGVSAIARVTSAQKAAFVRALRAAGEVVAMAGDGLNDAPAIRAADVGIAIGSRSSNVSREAADIVLASEDLHSVLAAVGEGRVVQDNLRRAVRYLFSTNLSEAILALGAVSFGAPDPFTPMRLLWLNLVSDSLPAVALAIEPADGDVLARPPAPPDAPMIDFASRRIIVRDALFMTGRASVFWPIGGPAAVFSALVGSQLGYVFACRSPSSPPPDERFIELVSAAAALHVTGICFPPVRALLRLPAAVSMAELVAFGVGLAVPAATARPSRDVRIVRKGSDSNPDARPSENDDSNETEAASK